MGWGRLGRPDCDIQSRMQALASKSLIAYCPTVTRTLVLYGEPLTSRQEPRTAASDDYGDELCQQWLNNRPRPRTENQGTWDSYHRPPVEERGRGSGKVECLTRQSVWPVKRCR
jgi:hypothetical protein